VRDGGRRQREQIRPMTAKTGVLCSPTPVRKEKKRETIRPVQFKLLRALHYKKLKRRYVASIKALRDKN